MRERGVQTLPHRALHLDGGYENILYIPTDFLITPSYEVDPIRLQIRIKEQPFQKSAF